MSSDTTRPAPALDVFDTKPLPPGHPLTRCEAVALNAHAAYKTRAAARRLLIAALDFVERLRGQGSTARVPAQ